MAAPNPAWQHGAAAEDPSSTTQEAVEAEGEEEKQQMLDRDHAPRHAAAALPRGTGRKNSLLAASRSEALRAAMPPPPPKVGRTNPELQACVKGMSKEEAARRKNVLSAKKCRERKVEYAKNLEAKVLELEAANFECALRIAELDAINTKTARRGPTIVRAASGSEALRAAMPPPPPKVGRMNPELQAFVKGMSKEEAARRKNVLSAKKCRERKVEYAKNLEAKVVELEAKYKKSLRDIADLEAATALLGFVVPDTRSPAVADYGISSMPPARAEGAVIAVHA